MNQARPQPYKRRELILAGGGIAMVAVLGWLAWKQLHQPAQSQDRSADRLVSKVQDNIPPAESFDTLRYVCEHGGDTYQQAAANGWLDAIVRDRLDCSPEQESFLLTLLRDGGHSSWNAGYRAQLFDSVFNILDKGRQPETYAPVLQQMAISNKDLILRLYALQHIAFMRLGGRITGTLGEQIHATVLSLASTPGEKTAGTAIWVLSQWDGNNQSHDPKVIALALETAANPDFGVDVRLTALHAAGGACLPLARKLAVDTSAPVLLRKAAIARVGQHGDASDLASLKQLRTVNFRISQAADPALVTLQERLSGSPQPVLIPLE